MQWSWKFVIVLSDTRFWAFRPKRGGSITNTRNVAYPVGFLSGCNAVHGNSVLLNNTVIFNYVLVEWVCLLTYFALQLTTAHACRLDSFTGHVVVANVGQCLSCFVNVHVEFLLVLCIWNLFVVNRVIRPDIPSGHCCIWPISLVTSRDLSLRGDNATILCFFVTQKLSVKKTQNFCRCSVHSEIYIVHSPTNTLFIKLGKVENVH